MDVQILEPKCEWRAEDMRDPAAWTEILNPLEVAEVAAANANRLGLRNVHWRLGSWFDALPDGRFDVIVSNPPYVAAGDPALAALCAEPALALTPGPSGLEAIAAIAAAAPRHLAAGGWILLEHGAAQGEAVAQLLVAHGFRHTRTHPDYAGRPRVTLAASSSPP